ncbi:MAG: four helix bundle protein [Phycisphaerales bacterium]|nr:four helix bundle protein [Phycisphaerales bacterium]
MKENNLLNKSIAFSIRIIKLYKFLCEQKKEYVLSKQLLRSGTAIAALLSEGEFAQSKADFISKFHIALKEANETKYWILLLSETEYINLIEYESIKKDCEELIKILVTSIKTTKSNFLKS